MVSDYKTLSQKTAEAIAQQLRVKPDCCLGLPTGRTPLGCYEILAAWSLEGKLDWSRAKCFALDDYLDAEEKHSFAYYLEHNLFQHTNLPKENRFNPRFFDNYDEQIRICGGLDLTVVGIGSNGHIAFNEPGTPINSWTHCIWLTESTRRANASFFGSLEQVPRQAVTMGIATILASRKLILIASGHNKEDILHQTFADGMTADIPATYLHEHNDLTVITDFS